MSTVRAARSPFRGLLIVVATVPLLLAACSNDATRSFAPSPDPGPPTVPPVSAAPAFPALARAGEIYVEAGDTYGYSAGYHGGAIASRFVLYADSTFGLQFSSVRFGFFEYGGRFTRADSLITFDWDGWSIAGKWEATGSLRGDQLSVSYNLIMAMTDFVDGMYVRSPTNR